jgi:geranylgeranyl reductase family protein
MQGMRDVIIVGGGPSGLHAARKLAAKGLDVLLLEKKADIGERVICTGIVGQRVFKEFDLARTAVLGEIQRMTMVSPLFHSFEYEHPYPFACVVDREGFDRSIRDQAVFAGAEIMTNHEVVDVTIGLGSVEVTSKKDTRFRVRHSSKIMLIATGLDCRLNRKLGLGSPKGFLNGVQTEIMAGALVRPTIFIGRSVAPGAFAWLIPIGGGKARIGLMTGKNPREHLERLIAKLYPGQAAALNKDSIQVKAIAQGLISKTFGDRVLAIGEAAGQVKTTTGGGIYFGLLCADIAADVVSKGVRNGRCSARDLAEYEHQWKKALQKEILVGLSLRKLFARMSDSTLERLFHLAKNDGVIPQVRERADFDWHGDLLLSMMKRTPFLQILKRRLDSFPILRMN